MAITASQVKELREITGAGMMDCKKALVATDGDVKKAIDWLREKGISKAAKKEGRTAADGLSKVVVNGNRAVIVELNSETDFVAKNEKFLGLLDDCVNAIMNSNVKTLDEALALKSGEGTLKDEIISATAIIGEHIALRRFAIVEKQDDEIFGTYMHNNGVISAVCVVKGTADAQIAKNMAMQIASMSPSYVSRKDMPQDIVNHEREIQQQLVSNDESLANKPEKVKAGIVEGRLSKSLQDMCLVDQIFFLDPEKKCGEYLKENNAEVVTFVKYKVGEGIEKKAENFAEEVAAMAK
ncbi:MAG: translation elongation factor Ts [Stecheria intestinalis]|jgi:elongation factor Ts|uniref:translation elongation factor Ts n=1 Tax=Stecheria intestinalis TaxID=2606630 RepID=UPI0023F4A11B|nr:translation elongation factor Ts [Stecheria intestinalis]MCI2153752.1 translation elongation factor Ts [Solobacterium sp.]MCI6744979.1 translation elongation factor Ts [Anaerolactibacter massiliensis]MDY3233963.1 translation elongation factor Ts [Erysipelotrichaceae bacterium]MDD5880440.1 translation elongation factor Ts [Stecheria intestinalis]MDD6366627.1 translation elongation factor Ts [Stecheria intestinalis]